jgi:hypothetical protein
MRRIGHSLALASLLAACGGSGPTPPSEKPSLHGTPLTLSLTEAQPSGNFVLTTQPAGRSMGWRVKTKPDWLTLDPDHGTVNGSMQVVATAAPPPTHAPGLMSGSIELAPDDSGGILNLAVEVDLPARPHLAYSSTSIAIPASSDTGALTITNDGRGPVSWRAMSAVSWLTVVPITGFLGTQSSTVLQVVVNRTALPPGTTTGSISVLSGVEAVATNCPVTIASPP